MVYGKSNVFDADRLIDLLIALENYSTHAQSARGDMDVAGSIPVGLRSPSSGSPSSSSAAGALRGGFTSTMPDAVGGFAGLDALPGLFPFPGLGGAAPAGALAAAGGLAGAGAGALVPMLSQLYEMSPLSQVMRLQLALPGGGAVDETVVGGGGGGGAEPGSSREALRFILSPEGTVLCASSALQKDGTGEGERGQDWQDQRMGGKRSEQQGD